MLHFQWTTLRNEGEKKKSKVKEKGGKGDGGMRGDQTSNFLYWSHTLSLGFSPY